MGCQVPGKQSAPTNGVTAKLLHQQQAPCTDATTCLHLVHQVHQVHHQNPTKVRPLPKVRPLSKRSRFQVVLAHQMLHGVAKPVSAFLPGLRMDKSLPSVRWPQIVPKMVPCPCYVLMHPVAL